MQKQRMVALYNYIKAHYPVSGLYNDLGIGHHQYYNKLLYCMKSFEIQCTNYSINLILDKGLSIRISNMNIYNMDVIMRVFSSDYPISKRSLIFENDAGDVKVYLEVYSNKTCHIFILLNEGKVRICMNNIVIQGIKSFLRNPRKLLNAKILEVHQKMACIEADGA